MNVQIAEQDPVVGIGHCLFLSAHSRFDHIWCERSEGNPAIELQLGAPKNHPERQNQQNQPQNDGKTAFFPPSHAAVSIERGRPESKQLRGQLGAQPAFVSKVRTSSAASGLTAIKL